MDLETRYQRGHCLGNPTKEGATLLGIGEVLEIEDLKFPILLDDSEDREGIVLVLGPEDGGGHA